MPDASDRYLQPQFSIKLFDGSDIPTEDKKSTLIFGGDLCAAGTSTRRDEKVPEIFLTLV
jgi:hypothetical protein